MRTVIRRLTERLGRNRAFRRRLPADFGRHPIYVSPDSQLKYLKPGAEAFDPELLQIARDLVKPGQHVWDIGGNIGVFAFAAAGRAENVHVLCIEADPWLAQLIRRTARLKDNAALRVQVLGTAASDKDGLATFSISMRGRASNSLASVEARSVTGGVREQLTVPTLRLDTLLDHTPAPDLVKIDVEGAEIIVLGGAERLLSEIRPLLYIEVGKGYQEEATGILHEAGYELFAGNDTQFTTPIDRCAFNTLARPRPQ